MLKKHHFILAKLLGFQRTFHEKSLCRGLGRKPQHSIHTKSTAMPCFFIFFRYVLELRSKPCFKGIFEKIPLKSLKTFAPKTPLCFGVLFILNSAAESYHLVDANARFCDNFVVQNDLFSALSANRIVHVHEGCCLHIRTDEIF